MIDIFDQLIFWIVVMVRFLLPLSIPRYPLPGIVGCMIVDAVDQLTFQIFTNLPLQGYQGFDKSLDIYYLTIAYISTLRNWPNLFAFKLGRSLFYYRLVGVALFELTLQRPLLLIFPNIFEYFFIFYEAARLRRDPDRLTEWELVGAATFILIAIKLPQEFWIHIAEMNTLDWIRSYPWAILILAIWEGAIVIGLGWLLRRVPLAGGRPAVFYDSRSVAIAEDSEIGAENRQHDQLISRETIEKIVLISLLSIIFAQVLPDIRASNLAITVGVAALIVINTLLSQWLVRRGTVWSSILEEFIVISAINLGIVLAIPYLLPIIHGAIDLGNAFFMIQLLTLNITLYDRYRELQLQRFAGSAEEASLSVRPPPGGRGRLSP